MSASTSLHDSRGAADLGKLPPRRAAGEQCRQGDILLIAESQLPTMSEARWS